MTEEKNARPASGNSDTGTGATSVSATTGGSSTAALSSPRTPASMSGREADDLWSGFLRGPNRSASSSGQAAPAAQETGLRAEQAGPARREMPSAMDSREADALWATLIQDGAKTEISGSAQTATDATPGQSPAARTGHRNGAKPLSPDWVAVAPEVDKPSEDKPSSAPDTDHSDQPSGADEIDFVIAGSDSSATDGTDEPDTADRERIAESRAHARDWLGGTEEGERVFPQGDRLEEAAGPAEEQAPLKGRADGKKKVRPPKAPKPPRPAVDKVPPFGGKHLGPILESRPITPGGDGVLYETPPTMASRLMRRLALLPFLLPLLLLAVQVVFTLDCRDLWYSDEVRYGAVYNTMTSGGSWVVMNLDGMIYPDKPPLFFWFIWLVDQAALQVLPGGLPQPMLFFTATALSGLLFLFAANLLAQLVGRVDKRTVLAANLILLGCFFFSGLLHYLRMDLMFTAFITFSHILLFHGLVRERSFPLIVGGFLAAGLAVLTKGPLGLAFPLLAGLVFVLWQGRVRRLFRLDILVGLLAGLAVPGVWLLLCYLEAGEPFVQAILWNQVVVRAVDAEFHPGPWYFYIWSFPLIWLPWTLVLFFLPWFRLFSKNTVAALRRSRTLDGAGLAYLWCAVLPGLILLSAISTKIPIYCLPLFPPLAVISARAMLRMRPLPARFFQYTMALVLAVLGICMVILPMVPSVLPLPYLPKGTVILGAVFLVFACALAFLARPRRTEGLILLMALLSTALAYPGWSVTAPSMDGFLSPKAQALVLKRYKEAGYRILTADLYPGTYTYWTGPTGDFPRLDPALAAIRPGEKVALAMRSKTWDGMAQKPEGFLAVHRQTIADREHVVIARPPLPSESGTVAPPAGPEPVSAPGQEAFREDAVTPTVDRPQGTDSTPDAATVGEAAAPGDSGEMPPDATDSENTSGQRPQAGSEGGSSASASPLTEALVPTESGAPDVPALPESQVSTEPASDALPESATRTEPAQTSLPDTGSEPGAGEAREEIAPPTSSGDGETYSEAGSAAAAAPSPNGPADGGRSTEPGSAEADVAAPSPDAEQQPLTVPEPIEIP